LSIENKWLPAPVRLILEKAKPARIVPPKQKRADKSKLRVPTSAFFDSGNGKGYHQRTLNAEKN
jgi:hypothetical protein